MATVIVEEILIPARYLRLAEAAQVYSISVSSLRTLIRKGTITAYQIADRSSSIRVSVAELEALFSAPKTDISAD